MSFSVQLDEGGYRELTRAAETPTLQQAWPDQWVDWGDHTVQVDPVGNKQWIHDSHDGHARSESRARAFDARDVRELIGWERDHSGVDALTFYSPTTRELDRADKFTTPIGKGCRSWRGVRRDASRFGELPTIEALKYEGRLLNKSLGDIEAEMREAERRQAHRLFDRSGYSR